MIFRDDTYPILVIQSAVQDPSDYIEFLFIELVVKISMMIFPWDYFSIIILSIIWISSYVFLDLVSRCIYIYYNYIYINIYRRKFVFFIIRYFIVFFIVIHSAIYFSSFLCQWKSFSISFDLRSSNLTTCSWPVTFRISSVLPIIVYVFLRVMMTNYRSILFKYDCIHHRLLDVKLW